jgi:hypothetical protein
VSSATLAVTLVQIGYKQVETAEMPKEKDAGFIPYKNTVRYFDGAGRHCKNQIPNHK